MTKKNTKTKDFGVSKREGHDSSRFYATKLYESIKISLKKETIDNSNQIDQDLFKKTLDRTLYENLPEKSIHLVIWDTSNWISKNHNDISLLYHNANLLLMEFAQKLASGGRLIVIVNNHLVTNSSTGGFLPYTTVFIKTALKNRFIMRGEIILSQPTIFDEEKPKNFAGFKKDYQKALVFCIDGLKLQKKSKGSQKTDTISRDQFLSYSKSLWKFIPSKAGDADSKEYISRFLQFYSFKENTIMIASGLEHIETLRKQICDRSKILYLVL